MQRIIHSMEPRYLLPALDLVKDVFTHSESAGEGLMVRQLVEEIRSKAYYVPALELVMVDETDALLGYAMFSRFPLEGRYADELLLLSPVAVKTDFQRQHISKELLEHGFAKAAALGFKAVLVEGNPRNYQARGFAPSYRFGIEAGPAIHLPHPDCLMVKELAPGALDSIHGLVDYSYYQALHSG